MATHEDGRLACDMCGEWCRDGGVVLGVSTVPPECPGYVVTEASALALWSVAVCSGCYKQTFVSDAVERAAMMRLEGVWRCAECGRRNQALTCCGACGEPRP